MRPIVLVVASLVTTIPTIGFNVETVRQGSLDLTLWDLGGGDKLRPLWQHYFDGTVAVIYVVDSTDRERFPEAREELEMFLTNSNFTSAIFLVLCNKTDLATAASMGEVWEGLGLGVASLPPSASSNPRLCCWPLGTGETNKN